MKLTLKEQIQRRIDAEGRTQEWIVKEMQKKGHTISSCIFSQKKNDKIKFSQKELDDLSEIMEFKFENE